MLVEADWAAAGRVPASNLAMEIYWPTVVKGAAAVGALMHCSHAAKQASAPATGVLLETHLEGGWGSSSMGL